MLILDMEETAENNNTREAESHNDICFQPANPNYCDLVTKMQIKQFLKEREG